VRDGIVGTGRSPSVLVSQVIGWQLLSAGRARVMVFEPWNNASLVEHVTAWQLEDLVLGGEGIETYLALLFLC
jgi:hypothetical protein